MADRATCRGLQFPWWPSVIDVKEPCVALMCDVYSEHYSAYAGCASARPPGADTRRPSPPPPLAGVVPFGPKSRPSRPLVARTSRRSSAVAESRFRAAAVPGFDSVHGSRHGAAEAFGADRRGSTVPARNVIGRDLRG